MKKYCLIASFVILTIFSSNVLACKMTALGGSVARINAVLDHISKDPNQQNSDIQIIHEGQALSGTYFVQTSEGQTDCQVFGYKTTIEPSCTIDVTPIPGKYPCTPQKNIAEK